MFEWVQSPLGMDFSAFLLELECDGKGCWGKKAGLLAPPKCDGIPSPAGGNTGLRAEAHGLTLAGRREVASPLEQGPTPNPEGRHGEQP